MVEVRTISQPLMDRNRFTANKALLKPSITAHHRRPSENTTACATSHAKNKANTSTSPGNLARPTSAAMAAELTSSASSQNSMPPKPMRTTSKPASTSFEKTTLSVRSPATL